MLEGMAPAQADAVRRRAGGLLLYTPVVTRDDFDAAIAYLVAAPRREHQPPRTSCAHLFDLTPGAPSWTASATGSLDAVAQRGAVDPDVPPACSDRDGERRTLRPDAAVRATSPTPTSRRPREPTGRWIAAPSSTRCRSWPRPRARRRRRRQCRRSIRRRRLDATGWPTGTRGACGRHGLRRSRPGAPPRCRSCRAARPVCGGDGRAPRSTPWR